MDISDSRLDLITRIRDGSRFDDDFFAFPTPDTGMRVWETLEGRFGPLADRTMQPLTFHLIWLN